MKFLCVSDQIDPLVYSSSVKERYSDIDAVFVAGDLSMEYIDFIVSALSKPTFFVFGNHDLSEYKYYKKHSIFGFDDSGNPQPYRFDEKNAHGSGADYASNKVIRSKHLKFTKPDGKSTPLLIAGVSGSMRYNNGQDQFTEGQMFRQLLGLAPSLIFNKIKYGRYCDVFLTHASPRHIHDKEDQCHKGFECFNWFIRKFKPALMIHGHIHLYDLQAVRTTVSHETTVVNAYSHLVVEYNPNFEQQGEKNGSDISIRTDR